MTETISIYESIARNLKDVLVKGVPSACTPSTLDSRYITQPQAGQLVGRDVYIYTGVGGGQARSIPSYDPANRRICIIPDWDTIPTNNSKFLIFSHWQAEDYENVTNRAMGIVKQKYFSEMIATMAIVATQYDYPVPSGMEYISNIRLVPSLGSDLAADTDISRIREFPPRFWHIEGNVGGSRLISFDPRKISLDGYNGLVCMIDGQCKPDFVATTVPEDVQEFIIAHATMQLSAQRVGESKEWQAIYYNARDMVSGRNDSPGLEAYITRYPQGRKVGA